MATSAAPAPTRLEQLITAYCQAAFPMADASGHTQWYTADPRAIFPIEPGDPAGHFHVPRSLAKWAKRCPWSLRVDGDFEQVIEGCAASAPGRESTWINQDIKDVFGEAFNHGFAHCLEALDETGTLVGGLYGLALGGAFFAESMFSRQSHGSKWCLLHLVELLQDRDFVLLDVQATNPHLEQFGVVEIDGDAYEERLHTALSMGRCW